MSDAPLIMEELKDKGVPAQNLEGERCSQTTEENAIFTSAILNPQQYRKVLLITDPPHMLRSFWVFQSLGYLPIPEVSTFPENLNPPERVVSLVREISGLVMYALTGRFGSRTPEAIASSPESVVHRLKEWNCKL